ncbi:hypothetical protein K492DRAFT_176134 [Lichtheimia hyalospora FSU 10163]|nr:hypothetical protein K492DRAFT_176134 [Lichtheimia hyalospora FSU 10163]
MTSLQPTTTHHYAMPFTFLPLPCRHEKPDLSYTSSSSFNNKPLATTTSSSSLHLPNITSQYGPWCCAPFSLNSLHRKDQQPALSTPAVDDPEMYALQTMFAALETRTNHSEHVAMSVAKQRQQQQTAGTHPAYVEALVDTTAHIIETIWPSSSSSTWSSAKQHATLPCSPPSSPTGLTTSPPPAVVSLRTFIQEVLKRSRTTYSTLQTALFYLFRARPAILSQLYYTSGVATPPSPPASENNMEMGYFAWQDAYIHCGRRMFLAALVTASKFVQDKTYRNSTWAKIAGLPVAEINAAERIFLNLISYRLYIAQPTFERWHHLLHMHVEARAANHPTTTTTTWLHYNHQHHASTTNTTTTTITKNRKRRSTLSSTTSSQDSKKRKVATITSTETSGRSYAANNKKSKRQ